MIKIVLTIVMSSVILLSCGNDSTKEESSKDNTEKSTSNVEIPKIEKVKAIQDLSTIEAVIEEFRNCKATAEKKHSCKEFVAKAICRYYNISDFQNQGDYDASGKNEFIDYDDIFDQVDGSSEWTKLGKSSDQDALDKAQANANNGIATLAIDISKNNKTVVLIVKGKQVRSTSWGVNCPMSAALNASKPNKSFVGKTLNYSFSNPGNIVIYTRE
jgi:hypothetical protein